MCPLDSPLAGLRVLVVEDEMIVAWLLQDMLKDLGCAIVGPAVGVAQALALIETHAVDAAVLDVNLNGELSYPIADALVGRGVPFMFSTGYDRARLQENYRSYPVLQKPFHGSLLRKALSDLFPTAADPEAAPAAVAGGAARPAPA